ncbi:MAG: TIGR04283 family arsenosugar biosynthesis glycosyltransferase [Alphaproteobacteria bacterium]
MISVIIPTLDEAAALPALLRALGAQDEAAEVVVADGGSQDGTADLARAAGARVVAAPRGRGSQLAAGAEAARGDVLLFLHADSLFPAGGLARIREALDAAPAAVGGNFRLVFDGETSFDRRLTAVYNRMRARGLYYGDSGIFVRRSAYDAIGGFRAYAVMEDYDFVARLERFGATLFIDEPPLVTSSRKFAGRRSHRIVWGWLVLHALYHMGVSPERLARIYYPDRA